MLRRLLDTSNRKLMLAAGGGFSAIVITAVVGVAAFGGSGGEEKVTEPSATATRAAVRRTATPTKQPTPTPTASPEITPTPEPVPIEQVQQQIDGPWSLPADAPPPPPPAVPPPPALPPAAVPSSFIHPPPYTVFLDAGHGGPEVGTSGGGWAEKNMNLDIAFRLRPILQAAGYNVVLDRESDRSLILTSDTAIQRRDEIQARVDIANSAGADILVSIHHNGCLCGASGTEVYYNPDRPFGNFNWTLGEYVYNGLLNSIRANGYNAVGRGVKNDGLVGGCPCNPHSWILGTNDGFPRPSMMPGIIGEALFMTSGPDMSQLGNPTMRQAIAQGYADGIFAYFSWIRSQVPPPTPTPTPVPTPPPPTPSPSPTATPPTGTPTPPPLSPTPTPPSSTPTPTSTMNRTRPLYRMLL